MKKEKKGAKKTVKRPSHKKPRPKKYVEAKIPSLPPVPTEQVPVIKEAEPVLEEAPKLKMVTVEVELPAGQTEEEFKNKLLKAAGQLKLLSEVVSEIKEDNAEAERKHRYPNVKLYTHPGIGLIRRREFPLNPSLSREEATAELLNLYANMLNEERSASGWSSNYEWVASEGGWRKRIVQVPKKDVPKKHWYSWFTKLIGR